MGTVTGILMVTDPAADYLIISVADAKIDLGILNDHDDQWLTRAVAAASTDVSKYCDRVFNLETVSETFHLASDQSVLVLDRKPVDAITSVTVDGTVLDADEYTVETETGLLYRLDGSEDVIDWTGGRIVVAYSGGYDEIPSDLQRACSTLVGSRRAAKGRDPTLRSERIPDVYEAAYWVPGASESGMPPDVRTVLDAYKRVSV